jgi:pantothenate synthetase
VELLRIGEATLLTAAARVGTTRLIDNVVLEGELR